MENALALPNDQGGSLESSLFRYANATDVLAMTHVESNHWTTTLW